MNRPSATALSVAMVVALSAALAATSHSSVWAPAREGGAPLSRLLTIVTLLAVMGAIAVVLVSIARARSAGAERSWRDEAHRAVPVAVAGVALVSLFAISRMDLENYRTRAEVESVDLSSGREGVRLRMDWGGSAFRRAEEAQEAEATSTERPSPALIVFGIILVVAVVALVALATAWWSTRRTVKAPAVPPMQDHRRRVARGAILASIEGMLDDPDPKTAIIGAYARLLERLSASGAARRDYEGPKEHLHRVLTVLDVPAQPLGKLIGLFEEARFSTHRLTARHRDEALDALRSVAAEFAEPSPSAPAEATR